MPSFEVKVKLYTPAYILYRKEQYAPTNAEIGMGIDLNDSLVETDNYADILNFFSYKKRIIEAAPEYLKEEMAKKYKDRKPEDYKLFAINNDRVIRTQEDFDKIEYREIPIELYE